MSPRGCVSEPPPTGLFVQSRTWNCVHKCTLVYSESGSLYHSIECEWPPKAIQCWRPMKCTLWTSEDAPLDTQACKHSIACTAVQQSMRCCKIADLYTLHVQEQADAMPFNHLATIGTLQCMRVNIAPIAASIDFANMCNWWGTLNQIHRAALQQRTPVCYNCWV